MKKGWIVLGVLCLIVFLFVSCSISTYNGLQRGEEKVSQTWADVESQYQRRFDLIPNYVEVVKGYATHEKETLIAVTEARAKVGQVKVNVGDTAAIGKFQAAQGELSSALSRLMVVMEKYPDLKANQNFLKLQDELAGTENRIGVARQRYNEAVRGFNSNIRSFPTNIINSMFAQLTVKTPFKSEEAAKQAPKVKF